MNAHVRVEDADKIKLELTMTLTLAEWRLLAEQLNNGPEYWPHRAFGDVIKNAIKKADVRLSESSTVSNM